MVPAGFDEGDEMLARGGEVGDGFMRQHLHRAPVLDRARVVLATAAGAQMGHLIVQRRIDVQQRAGDIQQQVLVDLLAASTTPRSASRCCTTTPRATPRPIMLSVSATAPSSLAWVCSCSGAPPVRSAGPAHPDAQQFFLHRAADRVEQFAVAPAQAARAWSSSASVAVTLSGAKASSTLSLTPSSPRDARISLSSGISTIGMSRWPFCRRSR